MDEDHNVGSKLHEAMDPVTHRKCTDFCWLLVLMAVFITSTVSGISSLETGEPQKLLAGIDYQGRVCGYSSGVTDLPYVYPIRYDGSAVCTASCPATTNTSVVWACVDTSDIPSYVYGNATLDLPEAVSSSEGDGLVNKGWGYCMWQYASTNVYGYCEFNDPTVEALFTAQSGRSELSKIAEDLWETRFYVFGWGFFSAMMLSTLFLNGLRNKRLTIYLIWGATISINVILTCFNIYAYITVKKWEANYDEYNVSTTTIRLTRIANVVLLLISIVWITMAIINRKSIEFAADFMKITADCVETMPALGFFPLFEMGVWILNIGSSLAFCFYTASSGTYVSEEFSAGTWTKVQYEFASGTTRKILFECFNFYWTAMFVKTWGQIQVAIAVSTWFFTRNDLKKDKGVINSRVVWRSLKKTFMYHLGTAALGGLLVNTFFVGRRTLVYLDETLPKYKAGRAVYCCCLCCFYVVEQFLRYLDDAAYVEVALYSTSFCESAKIAFALLERHYPRVNIIRSCTIFVLVVERLFVIAVSTCLSYFLVEAAFGTAVNSVLTPVVASTILSAFTAEFFTEVYGMSIVTIMTCFFANEEMDMGEDPEEGFVKDQYVHEDLTEFIDTKKKQVRKFAEGEDDHKKRLARRATLAGLSAETMRAFGESMTKSTQRK